MFWRGWVYILVGVEMGWIFDWEGVGKGWWHLRLGCLHLIMPPKGVHNSAISMNKSLTSPSDSVNTRGMFMITGDYVVKSAH